MKEEQELKDFIASWNGKDTTWTWDGQEWHEDDVHQAQALLDQFQEVRADERRKVVEWLEKRCAANIKHFGTDKWNSDMEDLLQTLKD